GATRGGPRTEALWLSFPAPLELHDYRFLGRDFTDRQRIKRKRARWRRRLQDMEPQERYAILAELASLREAQP
ncbi:MAG TPA: DNA adenine methylase, partial [Gammaproteobacteria bacterium]|nr:DNA adenine methylase [Gammaproteobacteria bacterium]